MMTEPTELGVQIMSVILKAALNNVFEFLRAIEEQGEILLLTNRKLNLNFLNCRDLVVRAEGSQFLVYG